MKYAILTLAILAGSAQAQGLYGNQYGYGNLGYQAPIESRANVFGGRDYYQGGRNVGSTRSNVFGGRDFYNSYGAKQGSTRANVFGGETLYDY